MLITSKLKFKLITASAVPAAKRAGKGDYIMSINAKDRVQEVVQYTPLRELPAAETVDAESAAV